jgi:hypothetical protein
MYRLCIFIVSSTLLVHMGVIREPFLPLCNGKDSSCATSMFFGLEGCSGRCGMNLPAFFFVMRVFSFSITMVGQGKQINKT